jgi:DNA-binding protein H-NS
MARSLDLSELGSEDLVDLLVTILERIPAQDLLRVREMVEAKRQEKLEEAKNLALEEFRGNLERIGLRLEDVLLRPRSRTGSRSRRRDTRQSAPIKYRSPQGEAWVGRGRVPQWLQKLEAEGHSRDEYAVDSEER